MPTFGGMSPFPLRFGGGAPLLERILESLNSARGTAFDTSETSTVYAENMAIARALAAVWSTNARLRNQVDPMRMTDFLSRWMKILRIPNLPSDTDAQKRALVAATFARAIRPPRYQAIADLCQGLVGNLFAGLIRTRSDTTGVVSYVPDSSWGSGYWAIDTIDEVDWYSTISHLVILLVKPAAMDDGEFYTTTSRLIAPLDSYLPSWMTFSLVRDGTHGPGFYLDEENNLDNQRFDS